VNRNSAGLHRRGANAASDTPVIHCAGHDAPPCSPIRVGRDSRGLVTDIEAADRPAGAAKAGKISKVEVLVLEKPLEERCWMANSPIGGYQPKASRLIVTVDTDAGVAGYGEGAGGGADIFRKGFADLVIGEDPFMVGKIWEKMFSATYGCEPSTRGWGARPCHCRDGRGRRCHL